MEKGHRKEMQGSRLDLKRIQKERQAGIKVNLIYLEIFVWQMFM